MKRLTQQILVALTAALLFAPLAGLHAVEVRGLRCEYRENPLGVDAVKPRLSWIIEAGEQETEVRGQKQTAYHVLVASSPEKLAKDEGDLWDSGQAVSEQSINVPYAGKELGSQDRCFWKVRIYDKDGKPTDWSDPAEWMMGLLKPDDWQAKWISLNPSSNQIPHPWLRRSLEVKNPVKQAYIYVATPGHYELYINGHKASDQVMIPAHVLITKRCAYNVFDVAKLLQPGKNTVALWLGPGWYQPPYAGAKAPIVRAQLEIQTSEGREVIGTDSQWRVSESCITQIGTWAWGNFGGECWEAAKFVKDWNQTGFDDSSWKPAVEVLAPQVECSWQPIPGSRLGKAVNAKAITEKNGKWVIDFGTTLTGWMRIRLRGLKPGQKITMEYADLTDPALAFARNNDGFQTYNQQDAYIAGSLADDEFCSKFNHHGFRYVLIAGLEETPAAGDAVAMSVVTDLERAGDFACSNELFNRIHQVTVDSIIAQMPCGVPGGGETRERLGYGDGGSFLTQSLYNFRSDALYAKWLQDWCDGQRPNGFLGHVAPDYMNAGGGPSWGGQASELARRLDLYFGDERAIEKAYPSLKLYVSHLENLTANDVLRYFNPYEPGNRVDWYFLGDWTPPSPAPDRHEFCFETDVQREFFNNCYRVLLWEQLARYADLLGKADDLKHCRERLAVLRPLIHKTYYNVERKDYQADRQAYWTIALRAQVVPPELRQELFQKLADDILIAKQGHLDTGLQGTAMLLDLLNMENRNDIAVTIMNQTTYPSWGFLLNERKVTTWPETWSGWGSQIINVVGSPGAWFYEGLAGIRPDPSGPGFKKIIIKPAVIGDVMWVKCHYDCPYGRIVSNWWRDGEQLKLEVTIPCNTTATVRLPGFTQIRVNGEPMEKCEFNLPSGKHSMIATQRSDSK